ncbi:unnamed protein product [Penicillium salamii]|uniref:Uncharacterized protein n=1 Tax=Penicillium salamii TaxID=1612424 RepID=A0A9W4NDU6_9EURO|nr:unnamed protein product [Penicillium salamii]
MSSNDEPVVASAPAEVPVEVDENEPPATPIEPVLSGGEEAAKSSPEAVKEAPKASPAKASPSAPGTAKRPVSGTAPTKRPTSSSASKPTTGTSRPSTSSSSTLNKPPTRPTTTTATRKPLSTSTTSSHRSRMSVSSSADEKPRSVASSGDEKRGISGTAKRMSMAGTTSTRAPLRPSPSIDRRSSVAGPTADRKPAVVSSRTATSTSKPVGRLTSATTPATRTATSASATRPSTTRPTPTASTVRSATTADPKKRLSTVPGAITRATESEKLQALQTKLSESEETVASLKTELEGVNEKLSQLSVSVEEPTGSASAVEANADHAAEIDRLTSAHTEELQALQVRLDDAEVQRKELEESSQKELEEARQSASAQGDDQTVALLDELKATHQTQLEAIEKELAEHKSSAAHFEEQIAALKSEHELRNTALEEEKTRELDHLTRELKGRDQVMENLNTEIVKLNTLKEQEIRAAEETAQQAVSTLQEQVSSLEAKLVAAESASKDSSEQTSSLAEKDQEINDLKQAIEKAQNEVQAASEAAASQLNFEVEQLGSAHEAAIAQLKAEHDAAISSLSATHAEELTVATKAAESNGTEHTEQLQGLRDALEASNTTAKKVQEDAIAELKTTHEAELKSLQDKLDASENTAQQGQDVVAELKNAHEAELKSLQEKVDASEAALAETRRALDEGNASAQDLAVQEIDALRNKCESLESELTSGTGKINALLEEMQSKQAEAEAIHRTLRDVEDHSKEESAQKDNKMRALEEKAAEATFLLDQYTAQAAGVSETHEKEIEELKAQHAGQLASELEKAKEASGSNDTALSDLQSKHDEVLASHKELESAHATRVQSIEADLKAAFESHASEIATHSESHTKLQEQFEEVQAKLQAELAALQDSRKTDAELHTKQITELQAGFEETKAQLQAELQATQNSKAADSDAEHGRAIEELLTMHESKLSGIREELENSNKSKIEELQNYHDAALASLTDDLSKAHAAAQDTSALEALKATIADLEGKLADSQNAHIAVQESAVAASRDIEGRYAAEIATIQAEHASLTEKYQATITQLGELQKSALDSDGQKSHLESIMKQLSESRDQLLKVKADNAAVSDSLVDCKNQNKTLAEKQEAGERDLNDQIDKNMGLLEQLGQFDSDISASRRRVRELETELAVLKADSADKSSNSGLGGSRWATANEGSENAEDGGPATTEGEDLGPSIEGTMASIQEQLKHVRTAHDDWYSEHGRLIGQLANISQQATPVRSLSTTPLSAISEVPTSAKEPEPARTRAATVSFFGKG